MQGATQGKGGLVFEVDPEVHARLVKASIIKQTKTQKVNEQTKRVVLESEGSQLVETGIAIARYIIGLKYALQV